MRGAPAAKSKAGTGRRGAAAAASSSENAPAAAVLDPDELLPRADISGSISGRLLTELGSAQWKDRSRAVDEVEGLVSGAGGRIQPNVGELLSALKVKLRSRPQAQSAHMEHL